MVAYGTLLAIVVSALNQVGSFIQTKEETRRQIALLAFSQYEHRLLASEKIICTKKIDLENPSKKTVAQLIVCYEEFNRFKIKRSIEALSEMLDGG